MGPNPTQYPQMVADIPQEEIPPLEEDVQEDPGEDNDSEDKNEGDED
jgi:hypothetical protein